MKFLFIVFSLFFSLAASEKSVAIFTFKNRGVPTWDPDSVKKGITGSEEAVIYMSEKLAKLGYRVVVLADPPPGSPHSAKEANPRYIDLDADDGQIYDIAISWRMPSVSAALKKRARHVYLWPHDLLHEQIKENQIDALDGVFWLSEWQRKQWISLSPGYGRFRAIYGNGINPEQFSPVEMKKEPYACIYGSNYARGLEILLEIWPMVKHLFPKATLDVYYGWQHWGGMTPEKEGWMRKRITSLASLGVQEHGLVGHDALNRAYAKASFWTYPCIRPETFCITALRAQLSGNVPVILQGSALGETVRHGFQCSRQDQYLFTLITAMKEAESISIGQRKKIGEFVLREFTWEVIAQKWHETFSAPIH